MIRGGKSWRCARKIDAQGREFLEIEELIVRRATGARAPGGPTRTADDKRIRFPFFNFEGPESNMTTFFIGATYTESISL